MKTLFNLIITTAIFVSTGCGRDEKTSKSLAVQKSPQIDPQVQNTLLPDSEVPAPGDGTRKGTPNNPEAKPAAAPAPAKPSEVKTAPGAAPAPVTAPQTPATAETPQEAPAPAPQKVKRLDLKDFPKNLVELYEKLEAAVQKLQRTYELDCNINVEYVTNSILRSVDVDILCGGSAVYSEIHRDWLPSGSPQFHFLRTKAIIQNIFARAEFKGECSDTIGELNYVTLTSCRMMGKPL